MFIKAPALLRSTYRSFSITNLTSSIIEHQIRKGEPPKRYCENELLGARVLNSKAITRENRGFPRRWPDVEEYSTQCAEHVPAQLSSSCSYGETKRRPWIHLHSAYPGLIFLILCAGSLQMLKRPIILTVPNQILDRIRRYTNPPTTGILES